MEYTINLIMVSSLMLGLGITIGWLAHVYLVWG